MMTRKGLCSLVTSGLLLLTPCVSNASFVLTIDDPTTPGIDVVVGDDITIGDPTSGGSGTGITTNAVDLLGGPGGLNYSGSVNGFNVVVTTGISKPLTSDPQIIDLSSIEVSGGAGNLIISLTDTDYTGSPERLAGLFGGTTIGTVDFDFLFDSGNTEFGGTSFYDPAAVGNGSFSGEASGPVTTSGNFSVTIIADVTHDGPGITSFDAEIRTGRAPSEIPVPAAIWLFGSGLIGMVGIARRRKV